MIMAPLQQYPGILFHLVLRDIVRVAKAADLEGDGKQEVVMSTFTTNPSLVPPSG